MLADTNHKCLTDSWLLLELLLLITTIIIPIASIVIILSFWNKPHYSILG